MAIGWAELLDEVQRTPAGTESLWTEIRELSARSPRSAVLEPAMRLAERLPAGDRRILAVTLATCVAPLEWPLEGEALRPSLTAALADLIREMDPAQPHSFPRTLDLGPENDVHAAGLIALGGAHELLRVPCRRDELRIVAHLCNRGRAVCHESYRRALARTTNGVATEALLRYEVARGRFVERARAFNQSYGNVLFETGEAPLRQGA